ncbi:L-type lectin-domain containing receptor kinase IV.1-like [Iris pallida]|uniref:non-specific serine/threonine protein kinase n=1 Tax=Iris pallida TaxID=29817 RepID=A0AAX6FZY9_IRIPA|nr:L-type lectin-domain containing receptor kinase IV.1-like [Iris pallida]
MSPPTSYSMKKCSKSKYSDIRIVYDTLLSLGVPNRASTYRGKLHQTSTYRGKVRKNSARMVMNKLNHELDQSTKSFLMLLPLNRHEPNMSTCTFLWPMFFFLLLLHLSEIATSSELDAFTFSGFNGAGYLSLDGLSSITSDGLLLLTDTTKQSMGHAFRPAPLNFRSPTGKLLSFSTTFVFAIAPQYPDFTSDGMAFLVSRTNNLSAATPNKYLGLFNPNNNGNTTNRILAVELDTLQNPEFQDIDNNHVGIDINGLTSISSYAAGYYYSAGPAVMFSNLSLSSGQPMQVWIDFDGVSMQLNVTMSPFQMPKPDKPLLSSTVDLSGVLSDSAYVGFSSATGSYFMTTHYVLGWSFKMNGEAEPLDYTKLPKLPRLKTRSGNSKKLAIWVPLALCPFVLLIIGAVVFKVRRRIKYAELLEDWELEYGPHRFSYKDLFHATNGFADHELLGIGGFGSVYRGVLPTSDTEIAVKKVSHDSRQGMKEFVAEIVSIGQLRHRNVVQLLGYCRRKGELLLVYSFMPNGSLDKFLHDRTKPGLDWACRFRVIKGVAAGLSYLHQEWDQVVIHRDIKASNVLLDSEMNGRIGDFGLARLYHHGTNPSATHVVGTMGYIAPEMARTGRATTATDVFAFGVFLLEVACGRRPLKAEADGQQFILGDWVLENWMKGSVLETSDPRLGDQEWSEYEMELVLKLGLLCSHRAPSARPSMRQVVQFLDGNMPMPELSPDYFSFSTVTNADFKDYLMSFPSSVNVSVSWLSSGR